LMCKQMLVTLPFVLLLLDYWPLERWPIADFKSHISDFKLLLVEKLPFFALSAIFSVVIYLVQSQSGATSMLVRLPLAARVENAVVSYVRYLIKLCWPLDLAVFYPHPGYWLPGVVIGAVLMLALVTVLVWLTRDRYPFLITGWWWYVGMLVPVIGLVQIGRQSMADRYTYLPIIGILLALVWGVATLSRERQRIIAVAGGIAIVLVCSGFTVRQVHFWKNTETLFRHAIEAVPNNYLAHANLSDCLQREGRLDEALREVDEALRLNPDDVNTRNSVGTVLMNLGRVDEAIGQFQEAVRRWPRFAEAHSNLASAYRKQGRLQEALGEFRAAIDCNPRDFRLQVNLAGLLMQLGQAGEAIAALETAVKLDSNDAGVRKDLATLLANAGRFEEAATHYAAATRLSDHDADAEAGLGICLGQLGRVDEAIPHLMAALKLNPAQADAQKELQRLRRAPDSQ
jgi:protein O-mannosyl-transferase